MLGHVSGDAVDPECKFKASASTRSAVELRNRLTRVTGLRLPTTLIFGYPTPAAVAAYLVPMAMPGAAPSDPRQSEEDEIRGVLATIPIGRMRQAGLLDAPSSWPAASRTAPLTTAISSGGDPGAGADESIDDMDLEALIRMTQKDVA